MDNVILAFGDGITALIKDNNYVIIELLFTTNQLTIDTLYECIIKIDDKGKFISPYFISKW
jgi:hypothetical protein